MSSTVKNYPVKSCLKWPGGKAKLLDHIWESIPAPLDASKPHHFVDLFTGSGVVAANAQQRGYAVLANDLNAELVNFLRSLSSPQQLIEAAGRLLTPNNCCAERYYEERKRFNNDNKKGDPLERAVRFLYLNRLGFNGLVRFNKKGGYNVPFGLWKTPPAVDAKVILEFAAAIGRCQLTNSTFEVIFEQLPEREDTVIYADPPYLPLGESCFTSYAGTGEFTMEQHLQLTQLAKEAIELGKARAVLISNHDTPAIRRLYQGARIVELMVRRSISASAKGRREVPELIAIFERKEGRQRVVG